MGVKIKATGEPKFNDPYYLPTLESCKSIFLILFWLVSFILGGPVWVVAL